MNKNQKAFLRNWEHNKKYSAKQGGKISLQAILDLTISWNNPTGVAMPQLLEEIHPFLYYNFIIDWSKLNDARIPQGFNSGVEFGRSVVKDWQEICWKQKWFNYGNLSNYDNIDQLREAYASVMGSDLYYEGGYEDLEERLYSIRQEYLDNIAIERQKEQERIEAERQAALAQSKLAEAKKLQDEANRKLAAFENEEQAKQNKEFSSKDNSPWSSGIAPKETPKPQTLKETAVIKTTKKKSPVVKDSVEYRLVTAYNEWNEIYDEVEISLHFIDGKIFRVFVCGDKASFVFDGENFKESFNRASEKIFNIKEAKHIEDEKNNRRAAIEEQIRLLTEQLKTL